MISKRFSFNSRSLGLVFAGAIAGIAMLSACGGGGGSSSFVPKSGGSTGNATAPQGHIGFSFVVPNATNAMKAFRKRPMYISSSSASLTVIVNPGTSGALTTTSTLSLGGANCPAVTGGYQCTVNVSAPGGNDIFEATLFDSNGNALSTGTTAATAISATGTNTVDLTFDGVPSKITVEFVGATPVPMASPTSFPVTVAIADADGATIMSPGTYAYPITLITSSSSHLTLTYNGTTAGTVTLTSPLATPAAGGTPPPFSLTASYDGANQDQFTLGVPYVTASVAPSSVSATSPLPQPSIVPATLSLVAVVTPGPIFAVDNPAPQATGDPLPDGVAYDPNLSEFFVTDDKNNVIYVYSASGGVPGTLATTIGTGSNTPSGAGPGPDDGAYTAATLCQPVGIVYDPDDQNLYFVDSAFDAIREIDTSTQQVVTIAGPPLGSEICPGSHTTGFIDGQGVAAHTAGGPLFHAPWGITYDTQNKDLYITDGANDAVRQVTTALSSGGVAGVVTTVAYGGALLAPGSIYTVTPGDTDGGGANGSSPYGTFSLPQGITYDADQNMLYVSDYNNNSVRAVDPGGATVKTFAGSDTQTSATPTPPAAAVVSPVPGTGPTTATQNGALFAHPEGIAYDSVTKDLYVSAFGNADILQITTALSYGGVAGQMSIFAGSTAAGNVNGLGTATKFNYPYGMFWTSPGVFIVTENNNHDLRIVQ